MRYEVTLCVLGDAERRRGGMPREVWDENLATPSGMMALHLALLARGFGPMEAHSA